jgi:glycosyltransferase involved in cell wall biosynthesis
LTLRVGALDARRAAVPWTGVGQYVTALRDGLPKEMGRECPDFLSGGGLRVATGGQSVPVDLLQRRRKLIFEQFGLPLWIKTHHPLFLHVPWYEGPVSPGCPLVVNIHDLDTLIHAMRYSAQFRWYYNGLLQHYARIASAIIVLSENTARDVAAHLRPRVAPTVIPLAAGPAFFNADKTQGKALLRSLGVSPDLPLAVSASGIGRRKNLETVGGALTSLAASGHEVTLAVTQTDVVPPALRRAVFGGVSVIPVGRLPQRQLANLIAAADVSICPSLYEGFGLSLIESMAAGCPVVASDGGSHPEIAGGAALMFRAGHADELADCIKTVLDGHRVADDLRARGRARATRFSWDLTVRDTVKVYQKIA